MARSNAQADCDEVLSRASHLGPAAGSGRSPLADGDEDYTEEFLTDIAIPFLGLIAIAAVGAIALAIALFA